MTGQNETIVDRVVARLKTQPLGDLITEEDLHDIVKQAIPKTFFEKRRIQTSGGAYPQFVEAAPLIEEIMGELLKDSAKKAVENWMLENVVLMADYWQKVVDKGLLAYVQKLQGEAATMQLSVGLAVLFRDINEQRSRAGMSHLVLPAI